MWVKSTLYFGGSVVSVLVSSVLVRLTQSLAFSSNLVRESLCFSGKHMGVL